MSEWWGGVGGREGSLSSISSCSTSRSSSVDNESSLHSFIMNDPEALIYSQEFQRVKLDFGQQIDNNLPRVEPAYCRQREDYEPTVPTLLKNNLVHRPLTYDEFKANRYKYTIERWDNTLRPCTDRRLSNEDVNLLSDSEDVPIKKKSPNSESKKEAKLRFKKEEEFEVFTINELSISHDLTPPPTRRAPLRGCLKKQEEKEFNTQCNSRGMNFKDIDKFISQNAENNRPCSDNYEDLLNDPSFSFDDHRNTRRNGPSEQNINNSQIRPLFSPANARFYDENSIMGMVDSVDINDRNYDALITELDHQIISMKGIRKKIKEEPMMLIDPEPTLEDGYKNRNMMTMAPLHVDFWEISSVYRRRRRIPIIQKILQFNKRNTKHLELLKSGAAKLLVAEVCRDYGSCYAKCFIYDDFPVNIVIVPLNLFPTPFVVPLGTIWQTTIDYVHCFYDRQDLCFCRVKFLRELRYIGLLTDDIPRRIVTFGTRGSSFYSETIQIYIRLKYGCLENSEQIFSPIFGEILWNRKVLDRIPPSAKLASVQGYGWLEMRPGSKGIFKEDRKRIAWLLVEPFKKDESLPTTPHVTFDPEYFGKQRVAATERAEKVLEKWICQRTNGQLRFTRPEFTAKREKAKIAAKLNPVLNRPMALDKKERRELVLGLVNEIVKRGTKTVIFDDEMMENVNNLLKHGEQRGTRLGKLSLLIVNYLKDKILCSNLEKNEPENYEALRQIVKWSIDYAPGGRLSLDIETYMFVFPYNEDIFE